jgi:hypothetical protein
MGITYFISKKVYIFESKSNINIASVLAPSLQITLLELKQYFLNFNLPLI